MADSNSLKAHLINILLSEEAWSRLPEKPSLKIWKLKITKDYKAYCGASLSCTLNCIRILNSERVNTNSMYLVSVGNPHILAKSDFGLQWSVAAVAVSCCTDKGQIYSLNVYSICCPISAFLILKLFTPFCSCVHMFMFLFGVIIAGLFWVCPHPCSSKSRL